MILPDDLAEDMRVEIPFMLHAWEPCDNDADYKCAFCQKRSNGNHGSIDHKPDCLGMRLYKFLME